MHAIIDAGRRCSTEVSDKLSSFLDIRLKGLAMLEDKKAHLTVPPAGFSDLKHVKTVNKLKGLAMLERRKAHLAQEDFTVAPGLAPDSTLEHVGTINEHEGLERRCALLAESKDDTLAAGDAQGSILHRRALLAGSDDTLAAGHAPSQGSSLERLERRRAPVADTLAAGFPLSSASS